MTISQSILGPVLGALLCSELMCNSGCALEKSVDAASGMARAIAEKALDKVDTGALSANASMDNPEYVVDGMFGTGFHLTIGLRGIKTEASVQGQISQRTDSDAEMRQLLHATLNDPSLLDKIIAAAQSLRQPKAATQPGQ